MSFQKQLDDFNRKLDMAPWYLGISILQEETIFSMHEKLRDDYEQGSGTTMYRALVVLGVKPVISTRLIRRLVQLSKNNILAFLFFILEGYYKTCRPKGSNAYSVNEQLLMIAIARIDMLPTLRALDEILPPPSNLQLQKMRANNRAARLKAQVRGTKSAIIPAARPKKLPNISPYFLKQPRPVSRISNATNQQSDFVVQFKFWPRNGPPNYGEEPKEPWFANYHPNPGMRLIKKTLSETLEKYFKSGHEIASQKNEVDVDGTKPQDTFCLAHKMQMTQEQLLRDELVVKARNRCLELLDVTQPYSKMRQKRIVAQLENDIDMVLDRHTREMQCDQTKVFTIENTDCVLCQHMLVSQPWPEPNDQVGRALVGEDCGMAHTAALDTYCGRRLEGGAGKGGKKGKANKGKKDKVKEPEPQPPEEPPKEEPKKKVPEWKPPPVKRRHEPFRITNIDFKEKLKKCPPPQNVSECEVPPAPKKSAVSFALAMGKIGKKGQKCDIQQTVKKVVKKKFFRASKPNKPYQFKYHRVFQSGQPRPFDLNRVVTKTFVKALNKLDSEDRFEGLNTNNPVSEILLAEGMAPEAQLESVPQPAPNLQEKLNDDLFGDEKTERDSRETLDRSSNHSRHSHIDYKAQIVEAVMECANTIWHRQAAFKRAEMEYQERAVKKKTAYFKEDEEYDPDNVEQMNQLLKDGLRILSRQPRYVLASLPDSHKLPVMREWIKRRFGKAYTQKELRTNMAESTRIFELVTLVQANLPNLNLQGLEKLPKSQENFDHYKQIKKTATDVKRDYHSQLNEQYMNSISSAWYAMGNYLVPSGPPRRTFFAYLASNPNEIMRAKTWNGDFRNFRQLRDNRRQMERN